MTDPKRSTSNVSEHEARAVAEASRETSWTAPSFVRELFLGSLKLDRIHPYPEPDPEEQKRAQGFLDQVDRFLEDVDAEQIEHDARIPEHLIQKLRDIGAFGIRSRGSTAGSGSRSTRMGVRSPRSAPGRVPWWRCCRRISRSVCPNRSNCSATKSRSGAFFRGSPRAPSRRSHSPRTTWVRILRA